MAKVDGYHNIAPVVQIPPAAYADTQQTDGVDLYGYESCTFLIYTGVITDGTWTVTFEESDEEDANFTPIDPNSTEPPKLIGTVPGPFTNVGNAFDNKLYKVGYIGLKRYVRAVITETVMGTAIFGVIVERGTPHSAPTPNDPNA